MAVLADRSNRGSVASTADTGQGSTARKFTIDNNLPACSNYVPLEVFDSLKLDP